MGLHGNQSSWILAAAQLRPVLPTAVAENLAELAYVAVAPSDHHCEGPLSRVAGRLGSRNIALNGR
jgi:hypothetical protein